MVVWGGLRPIAAQAVVDFLGLLGFGYVTVSKPCKKNTVVLVITAVLTVILSGNLTNRWTVIFPMVPFLVLQTFRCFCSNKWIAGTLTFFSMILVLLAGLLSVLFPAVELPPLEQEPYNVGVVDLFLPVDFQFTTAIEDAQHVCPKEQDHVTVRILYPTLDEKSGAIPYLKPETSVAFCEVSMKAGAPPPLKELDWILHYWRLAQVDARKHAQPLNANSPVIFFSPGLGGSAEIYTYQTRALAANGFVVVVLDHTDGSAPAVLRKDGTILRRNDTHVLEEWVSGRKEKYKRSRRAMTEYRAEELLHTVESILGLNSHNLPELEGLGISFVDRLNVGEIHYMGHSFGGSTAFHAARQRPPTSIIAHEPASEWIPDATRGSLFEWAKVKDSSTNYTYLVSNVTDEHATSVHDTNMLVLFSHDWYTKQWGGVDVLTDLHQRGLFGPEGGVSRVHVIDGAHHNEFSDTSMMTPLWLARPTGQTGKRNPLETAKEIHQKTLAFLRDVRERQKEMGNLVQS